MIRYWYLCFFTNKCKVFNKDVNWKKKDVGLSPDRVKLKSC